MATERVTYRTERGGTRTIYLQDAKESHSEQLGELLSGVEVDKEGDEVHGKGFDERHHLISLDAVIRREAVVMDKIYGEFVEVSA